MMQTVRATIDTQGHVYYTEPVRVDAPRQAFVFFWMRAMRPRCLHSLRWRLIGSSRRRMLHGRICRHDPSNARFP